MTTFKATSKLALLFVAALVLAFGTEAAQAENRAPGWEVTATTYPTNIAPSGGTGMIQLNVTNVGAEFSKGTVTVTDVLPPGVIATQAGDVQPGTDDSIGSAGLWNCTLGTVVTCTNDPQRLPQLPIPQPKAFGTSPERGVGAFEHIGIVVTVQTPDTGTLTNRVTVTGGGALAPATTTSSVTVSPNPASFGIQDANGWVSNADGTIDTRAGSHPYDLMFTLDFNTVFNQSRNSLEPAGDEPRNIQVNLPPGLVGNPSAVPECPRQAFEEEECPPATQIGVDQPYGLSSGGSDKPEKIATPVTNLVPPPGVAAQFGIEVFGVTAYIDATVRSGGSYGITAHVSNLPQKVLMGNTVVLWGEPADSSHDEDRFSKLGSKGNGIGENAGCSRGCSSGGPRIPFLTLASSCEGPQSTAIMMTGWRTDAFSELSFLSHDGNFTPAGLTGCDQLGFGPSISLSPDTTFADTPTGLTADVRAPQEGLLAPGALATSNLKNATVALPPGMVINPGQAAGLKACQPGDVPGGDDLPLPGENGEEERFSGPPDCPSASKVGTVQITTPLLKESLEGNVYVLQSNPPDVKLLVTASGQGVNLKLIGDTELCETTGELIHGKACEAPGQLITTFSNTPELPFTDFKLSFSGGAQAALDTPTQCATYSAFTDFTPWSTPSVADAFPSSAFAVTSGPGGSPCPGGTLPFAPTMTAGSTTDQAGAFTNFSLLLQRGDGQQRVEKLSFKEPAGLAGLISSVPLCPEPQASQGTCPAASHIGHAVVASGPGPYPLVLPQPGAPELPIYLTGTYAGAPFGLSIVTPVVAGPFNLGTIITRAKIEVDPHTAQITITTDPLPQIVDGVPTDLRSINSIIDRPGFLFNPTNCTPAEFTGTATSAGGAATAPLSSHFGVGSCKELKFAPKFSVSTSGKTSKANGAGLTATLAYPAAPQGTQVNIARVKVDLPKQLPSRLTTLQKACTAAQFEANPAGCPAASKIGMATVTTPVLPVPLVGPAIFVSHGGEAFPSLTMVLQGYGVTVDLVGTTFISKAGITSTTFKTVPDVPFNTFKLTLPQGKYSALAANGNLCASKLAMPTAFIAQNGAEIHQSTKIGVTGCAKAKALTRAQRLAKALRACHRKGKARRAGCEKAAHKRFGVVRAKKK